jgi:hypothetical protein
MSLKFPWRVWVLQLSYICLHFSFLWKQLVLLTLVLYTLVTLYIVTSTLAPP